VTEPPRSRRDDKVRRMLAARHPVVPPGLAARAAERGRRIVRRRRAWHTALWVLLVLAVAAGVAGAVLAWPHRPQPGPGPTGWWTAG
jgi:hypothetical protein